MVYANNNNASNIIYVIKKKYGNKLTNLKKDLERIYYSDQLDNIKTAIQKSWNIMKSVIGNKITSFQKKSYFMINNERIENYIRISNEFNNYFVCVGSTLASNINVDSCNPLDYIRSNVQSMAIPNYYENDVTLAINSLKK